MPRAPVGGAGTAWWQRGGVGFCLMLLCSALLFACLVWVWFGLVLIFQGLFWVGFGCGLVYQGLVYGRGQRKNVFFWTMSLTAVNLTQLVCLDYVR